MNNKSIWGSENNFGLPDDDTGNALARLAADGSDLNREMEVEFFIAVPAEKDGLHLKKKLSNDNFKRISIEYDADTKEWTFYCLKNIIPSYENVTSIERYLTKVSKEFNGSCDGFGSFGNVAN